MAHPVRTPQEWFQEAARCYLEGHQACAWCGGSHVVRKEETPTRVEYHCGQCDFGASQDRASGRYAFIPGESPRKNRAPVTMFDM